MFEDLSVVHLFFNGAGREQAVDGDRLRLPNPPHTLTRLHVRCWVPIRIKQKHTIGSHKVDTESTNLCREQEYEAVFLGSSVVIRNVTLPRRDWRVAIHARVGVVARLDVGLQNVQHLLGLGEHKSTVPLLVPHFQHLMKHQHLPGPLRCAVVHGTQRRNVVMQQVRVVTDLAENADRAESVALPRKHILDLFGRQHIQVMVPLCLGQLAKQHLLRFRGQLQSIVHVLFEAPHEVRVDSVSQHLGTAERNTHLTARGVRIPPDADRRHKLGIENRQRAKTPGEDKVEQRPELTEIVLHGRAGEDDAVDGAEALAEKGDVRVWVANHVPFVKDDVPPPLLEKLLANPRIL